MILEIATLAAMMYLAFNGRKVILYNRLNEIIKKYDVSLCSKYKVNEIREIHNITKNIKYVEDTIDKTKTPSETLRDMEGDCEDIALVVYSIAKCSGFKSGIVIMYSDDDELAHSVAYVICSKSGKYFIFSNNDMFTVKDLSEATSMLGYDKYISIGD